MNDTCTAHRSRVPWRSFGRVKWGVTTVEDETGERCRCRSLPITPPASLRSHGSRPRPTRHNVQIHSIKKTVGEKYPDYILLSPGSWSAHPIDTLLSHEATGEDLWMAVKWQQTLVGHMTMTTWLRASRVRNPSRGLFPEHNPPPPPPFLPLLRCPILVT